MGEALNANGQQSSVRRGCALDSILVDPRLVWAHEAHAFTWLQANADRPGEALGIDIELEAAEHSVGGYSLDLVGRDVTNDAVLDRGQPARRDRSQPGTARVQHPPTRASRPKYFYTAPPRCRSGTTPPGTAIQRRDETLASGKEKRETRQGSSPGPEAGGHAGTRRCSRSTATDGGGVCTLSRVPVTTPVVAATLVPPSATPNAINATTIAGEGRRFFMSPAPCAAGKPESSNNSITTPTKRKSAVF